MKHRLGSIVVALAMVAAFVSLVPTAQGAAGPATIISQPASQVVFCGDPVAFAVGVDGTPPFYYQWLRAGTPIQDATNFSYTIPITSLADNGAIFNVLVTNSLGGATSIVAVLTIDPGILNTNTVTLVSFDSVWRYNQTGNDLGMTWTNNTYNDTVAGWLSGPGAFDVKSSGARATVGGVNVGTQLSLGSQPAVNDITTYYFRTPFSFNTSNIVSYSLWGTTIIDDGAALYVNGQELNRNGVDVGATAAIWANRTVGDPAQESFSGPSTVTLVNGTNILAAEVHQVNATSSDLTWGLELYADVVTRSRDNIAPVMLNTLPLTNATVRSLTQVEVIFSEPVANVDAGDLLINGVPATGLSFGVPGQVVFTFPQPPTGVVVVGWAPDHGIHDLAVVPNAFDGGFWTYTLNPNAAFAEVRINEFMADNQNGIRDEDGTRQDWIELYNPAGTVVDLSGWYLTDDSTALTKWRFPNGLGIQPNGYLLIWASSKDRTNSLAPLHTSFRLNKGSGYLALVLPDGSNVVSAFSPTYPVQYPDVSYGRDRLDPDIVGYYTTPTPRAANATGGPGDFTSDVVYSRRSGTFVNPFNLTLSTRSANAVIRYVIITNYTQASISATNIPTTNSPIYTNPIPITTTTQVRARAFEAGLFPSMPMTESYLQISSNVLGFSSDRPLCVVHGLGAGSVSASPQTGIIMLFDNGSGGTNRSSLTNAPQVASRMGFHLRGSSTLSQAKSNFRIEYWDEYNQDIKLPFLDMPDESDWVLYGIDGFDPGLMHNAIYHWMGRQLPSQTASRTRYIEVFRKIDGGPITTNDYFGLYLVEENPKVGKDRLDIANLELQNTNLPSISGGYLMRIDRSGSTYYFSPSAVTLEAPQVGSLRSTPAPICIDDPKIFGQSPTGPLLLQANYIKNYIQSFVVNLASVNYKDPVAGYARYLDPDQWVDHLIGNIICFNVDGYRLSGYFYKDRDDRLKQGPYWDCDRCMGTGGTVTPQADNRCFSPFYWRLPATDLGTDNGTDFFGLSNVGVSWFERLFRDPDFWQRFIDRYQMYRTNEYSLTKINAMIDGFYNEIKEAQVREQARWAPSGFNYPRSGSQTVYGYTFDFGPADNAGRGRFTNEVRFQKQWFADRLLFMDTNFLSMPTLSSGTALLPTGSTVTVAPAAKAGSLLLYTLNGTDPRLPGGAISPLAKTNSGSLALTVSSNVWLVARSYNVNHANLTNSGSEVGKPLINSYWSGPVAAAYFTQVPALRVTEIMYHPGPVPTGNTNASGDFEYIELTNTGTNTLSLVGFSLTNGISFVFTATNRVTSLAPGGRVLVVRNLSAFATLYSSVTNLVAGEYAGSLNNGGERIYLRGPLGEPILDFSYDPTWYPLTDGIGFSLVVVDPNAAPTAWTNASQWRMSTYDGGSPGLVDPAPVSVLPLIVNEILANPVGAECDSVELFNPNSVSVDLGGWYLTDNYSVAKKYRIPDGSSIPAYGFATFYATNSFGAAGQAESFGLSSEGEEVYVFSGDATGRMTGYYQGFDFGPTSPGVSIGRHINSMGLTQYVAQSLLTLGATNSAPLVGPIVISEIMAEPPALSSNGVPVENYRDEFIELKNISLVPVPLYDIANPNNTWTLEKAVSYAFPPGVVLPPNGFLLVVGFDPSADPVSLAAFRARFGLSDSLPVYGPYDGHLNNAGERLELRRPGVPNAVTLLPPMILADRIDYTSADPWPHNMIGLGASLNKCLPSGYGNDPTNWATAAPTPGADFLMGSGPSISRQPASLVAVESNTVTFTVLAAGVEPLSYQWLYQGQAIDGANQPSLVLSDITPSQTGEYQVLVMNRGGTAISDPATLIVLALPTIDSQPKAVSLTPNPTTSTNTTNTVTFSVAASGGLLRYQWRLWGTNLPGATSSNLVIKNASLMDAGPYEVLVSNDVGFRMSQPAWLMVLTRPSIVVPIVGQSVPAGGTASFSVWATPSHPSLPLSYQWMRGGSFFLTNDQPTLIVSNVPLGTNLYLVKVVSAGGAYNRPQVPLVGLLDSDHDGVPDQVELALGYGTNNPADGALDYDGDGMNNADEVAAGTDPKDPSSVLRMVFPEGAALEQGVTEFSFTAVSNHTYSVEYKQSLQEASWNTLLNFDSLPTNRVIFVTNSLPAGVWNRFYRVKLPRNF